MIASEWITLAASALAIAVMAGFASLLGFRTRVKLDPSAVAEAIADYDRSEVVEVALDARGQAALARLADGRLALVRTVADGTAVRVFSRGAARARPVGAGVSIVFPDLGFPPTTLREVDADAVCAWVRPS